MNIKDKITGFISRGDNLRINTYEEELWYQEIKIFSNRYLNEHPTKKDIDNIMFFKKDSDSLKKMIAILHALLADENIHFEKDTLERKQRKIISQQKDELVILFFASNPDGVQQLNLDVEARMIEEAIRKSEYRNKVHFISKWATQTTDILQGINEINPDVIHFSSHGTIHNELVLQNSDGSPKTVTKEAISYVISTVSDKVKLVFFNSCFSSGQANEIVKSIDSAIGMRKPIGDKAACIFATQFYSSLIFGLSLENSFKQARASLMLEGIKEDETPELFIKDNLNASNIYFFS